MLIIACIKPPLVVFYILVILTIPIPMLIIACISLLILVTILVILTIPIPMLIIACIKPPLTSLLYLSYSNNPYPYVNNSMY